MTRLSWAASDWIKYDKGPFPFLRIQLITFRDSKKPEGTGTNVWMELSHIRIDSPYEYGGGMESSVTSLAFIFNINKLRYRFSDKYDLSINPGLAICRVNADYLGQAPCWPNPQPRSDEFHGGEIFLGFPIFAEISISAVLYKSFRIHFPVRLGSPALFQFVKAKLREGYPYPDTIQERNYPFPYTGLSSMALLEYTW
jgi:hypothetical protein